MSDEPKNDSKPIVARDDHGRLKPGSILNPVGGSKGSRNPLKTFQREVFDKMTPEEKVAFLAGIPPELRWRMAEGNPKQETELSGDPELPFILKVIIKDDGKDDGNKREDSGVTSNSG